MAGISEALKDNTGNNILVAAHHPMFTYGIHGGISTFREHIFPLTEIKKWLYIPLPGLGSIYPLYRKKGSIQDINHPISKSIRSYLIREFKKYPNLIHAAGHEHSLQYITHDQNHYIVSGTGSKTTPVKVKEHAKFAESHVGFAKLKFYTHYVQLEFWKPVKGSNSGKIAFSTQFPLKAAGSNSDF